MTATAHGWWRIVSASVPGDWHLQEGGACEDAVRTMLLPDGTALIAVADGASAAPCGAAGAALAVDVARVLLVERLSRRGAVPRAARDWLDFIEDVVDDVNERLVGAAHEAFPGEDAAGGRFRTTLAIVVLTDTWCTAAVVGDALVCIRRSDGSLHAVIPPVAPGAAADRPDLLPVPGGDPAPRTLSIPENISAVLVATDGMSSALLAQDRDGSVVARGDLGTRLLDMVHAGSLGHTLTGILLQNTGLRARTADDRTLVIATRDQDARPWA